MPDTRELLLLRHAKSDWKSQVDSDFQRPLSKRGMRDAPRVGQWLREQGLVPDLVIASPAMRARRTAVEACNILAIPENRIHWEERVYDAAPETLLLVLGACPQARRVLLVGHNPGLEGVLAYLCGPALERPPDEKTLPTATLAQLGMPWDWHGLQPNSARLISLTRPAAMATDGDTEG